MTPVQHLTNVLQIILHYNIHICDFWDVAHFVWQVRPSLLSVIVQITYKKPAQEHLLCRYRMTCFVSLVIVSIETFCGVVFVVDWNWRTRMPSQNEGNIIANLVSAATSSGLPFTRLSWQNDKKTGIANGEEGVLGFHGSSRHRSTRTRSYHGRGRFLTRRCLLQNGSSCICSFFSSRLACTVGARFSLGATPLTRGTSHVHVEAAQPYK